MLLSVNSLTDLWTGPAPSLVTTSGQTFTGVLRGDEYRCVVTAVALGHELCKEADVYTRFIAIDSATMTFAPIDIAITAGGVTERQASPVLTWDAGNDDLPGGNY